VIRKLIRVECSAEPLFREQWADQGIAFVPAKTFRGQRNVAIWVSQFVVSCVFAMTTEF
jgi:hypothetical protein